MVGVTVQTENLQQNICLNTRRSTGLWSSNYFAILKPLTGLPSPASLLFRQKPLRSCSSDRISLGWRRSQFPPDKMDR